MKRVVEIGIVVLVLIFAAVMAYALEGQAPVTPAGGNSAEAQVFNYTEIINETGFGSNYTSLLSSANLSSP